MIVIWRYFKRRIHFGALEQIVGWVKRDMQAQSMLGSPIFMHPKNWNGNKLANPTKLAADCRLNPTCDLLSMNTKAVPPLNLKVRLGFTQSVIGIKFIRDFHAVIKF
jgi:hypothetical protein